MKKSVGIIIFCFVIILIISLFGIGITGYITKENIIISISPQGELNNNAGHISVFTSEKAKCMYNLGDKMGVAFKYYSVMAVTNSNKHTQLIKDLDAGEYELSIKCTDNNGFSHRKDVDLEVIIPEECKRYCQYADDCDEYASDGCGLVCKRDTGGINCGDGLVCKDSFCVEKEKPSEIVVENIVNEEELPVVVVEKKENILDRIFGFFKNLFK